MSSWHRSLRRPGNGASSPASQSLQGTGIRSRLSDRRRPASSTVRIILRLGLVGIMLWMFMLGSWSHSILTKNTVVRQTVSNNAEQESNVETDEPLSIGVAELWPDDYASKAIFDSLKGCDPNKEDEGRKCPRQPASPTGSHHRIGLLYPPGSLSYMFTQFIKDVVRLHAMPDTDLELIPTTHIRRVDQHNFTKVIRLAILPLMLSASDTILSTLDESFPMKGVTIDDLTLATRQLIRWHCHLSRVAKNTPLMTMTLADLVENPWEAELNVRSFLSLEPHDPNNSNEWAEKHVDEDEMMASLEEMVKYCSSLFEHLEKTITTRKIQQLIKGVIDEELQSNALACKTVSEGITGESIVSQTLGAFLSPDAQLSNAICKKRAFTPICKDREAPISSRSLQAKVS